ncbi:cardiolipin synthase [Pseudalkalibacillus berkeleyi]|uniref:Cardiolipin synthase n=1 Tax=Pseudalkalibacillus berkeleyi TaxID=1069813 RepID=A0ABS9GZM5_9BACL|nr:cardiolipin synthase [Pseudalkalibacillus berkeleyi]MCF6136855.1 cardiolipin synthase [Pseudalkalibacillus berkeleyi]
MFKKTLQVMLFLAILVSMFIFTKPYWENWILGVLSIFFTFSALFIGIVIFLENRHPSQTLTWFVVLAAFPLLGFFFYMLFGRNYRKKRMFDQKALKDEEAFSRFEQNRPIDDDQMKLMGDHQRLLFKLAQKLGKSPISFNTDTQILTNGKETYEYILNALRNAKEHIHMEYYIVRDDGIGTQIQNVLLEKAREGVEVRFLYDAVGSWKLSREYINTLKEAGVQAIPFLPVKLPLLNNKINYRNHRKIVVIDGNVAFVGGLNIGDEYLGLNKAYGFWRDTHLMVKGEAVRSLQLIFLQDWYSMTGETLLEPNYLSPEFPKEEVYGGVQMISGGPDHQWDIIKKLFFSMIVSAKQSIWITSPYFIPDEDILNALRVAALSGIDVRLLFPAKPDKKLPFHASRSYFPSLLEAGVNIYEYQKGFLHSKMIIVDSELASIGTANMDMRSFHLNFEVNAFLYRTKSTQRLVEDYLNDIKDATPIQHDTFKNRKFYYKVIESTSRLLSPLL